MLMFSGMRPARKNGLVYFNLKNGALHKFMDILLSVVMIYIDF
jgi:hypothetical protein